jgi:sugar phosphate isomerase/epimerase
LDKGFIDIPAFFGQLRKGGYNGLIICELARGQNGQAGSVTDEEKSTSLTLAHKWWVDAQP